MELKWLEDFVTVASLGHFARAADERFVTQSALSRRIKSLEYWVGAELLDRSQHPVKLTAAGEEFIGYANEIIEKSYAAQNAASESSRKADNDVTLACLHTLALYRVPNYFKDLRKTITDMNLSIIAETRTIDEYFTSLANGSCDFFLCFRHFSAAFTVDATTYPYLTIGTEKMVACHIDPGFYENTIANGDGAIPYLAYSGTSFLSSVVRHIMTKTKWSPRLDSIYKASLCESLATAMSQGLGMAWLPMAQVREIQKNTEVHVIEQIPSTIMEISLFRSANNSRPIINKIWEELQTQVKESGKPR